MPKHKSQKKKSPTRLNPSLIRLVESVQKLRTQAKALGVFSGDRELLECNKCGLIEDVTDEGILITYKRTSKTHQDSGLRFQQFHPTHFRCPQCNAIIEAKEEEFV